MKTEIKLLKAHNGDCFMIKTFADNKPFNILIDGGTATTFTESIKKELKDLQILNLLILTHPDSDHIGGLIRFFKNSLFAKIEIERFWINAPNLLRIQSGEEISYDQGITLEKLFVEKKQSLDKIKKIVNEETPQLPKGIEVQILSPTTAILEEFINKWPDIVNDLKKEVGDVNISTDVPSQLQKGTLEDLAKQPFSPSKSVSADIANSSSIAFIIKLADKSVLFLGDSRPEIIVEQLMKLGYTPTNPLSVDFTKISHHGSINNTSNELLDLLDCDNFIISTNGGTATHKHPDREVIACLIHHPKRNYQRQRTIYFNYPLTKIEAKAGKFIDELDLKKGNWKMVDDVYLLP